MTQRGRHTLLFFLFISPWLLGFLMLTLGPTLASLYLSFTKYNITEPPRWVGAHNYAVIFKGWEPNFYNSVKVTCVFTAVAVPLNILVALSAALLLNVPKIKAMSVFRTIYFLPALLPAVASTIIWAWVFDPKFGYLNALYAFLFGEPGPNWLQEHALGCLVTIAVWGFGNTMMIFLAALQDVPTSLLEAATIDGANAWGRFRHVTIPIISPAIFFNVVVGIIASLQIFTQAFVFSMANVVNHKAVHFYVLNIYQHAFEHARFGLASALAWILMAAVFIMTLVQFYLRKKWVFDNG
jgi:ABC-type sugar transport system permease subunit